MEINAAIEENGENIRKSSKSSHDNEPTTDDGNQPHHTNDNNEISDNDAKEIVTDTIHSENKSPPVEETHETKTKDPIPTNNHKADKPEKRKMSLSQLFSCGTKKKVHYFIF